MGYKHDYITAMNRLVTILKALYEGRELSVKELAEEFGVSTKTVQRDFNDRLSGLPIEKVGHKWRMKPEHAIGKETLTQHERLTLDLLHGLSGNLGPDFSKDASRLLERLRIASFPPIYARLNMEDISHKAEAIALLEQAIGWGRQVRCLYAVGSGKNKITLTLQPLKLACFEGFWYLLAIDTADGCLKKLHLGSVDSLEILKESFKRDETLERKLENALSVWFDPDARSTEVILLAQKPIAKYFERKPLPTQRITRRNGDGSIEISLWISHEMELFPLVQYWIPHLSVVEPSDLATAFKDRLGEYIRSL